MSNTGLERRIERIGGTTEFCSAAWIIRKLLEVKIIMNQIYTQIRRKSEESFCYNGRKGSNAVCILAHNDSLSFAGMWTYSYLVRTSWSRGSPSIEVSICHSLSHCQAIEGTRIFSSVRSTVPSSLENWYLSVGSIRFEKPSRGSHLFKKSKCD